jgi:hypothetical protein
MRIVLRLGWDAKPAFDCAVEPVLELERRCPREDQEAPLVCI